MIQQAKDVDERLDKIDAQLERIAKAVAQGFAKTSSKTEVDSLRGQIDIYARAVDAYAKTYV